MIELPRFILGIDPGKRTGISLYDLLLEEHQSWEVAWEELGAFLEDLISKYSPYVLNEQFVINHNTVKNTQAPWSLMAIGVAEYLAMKYECKYKRQAQSSAKRFASNDRLKALGWYVPGKGHAMDAARQTLLFLVDHGWWSPVLDLHDTMVEREGTSNAAG